MVIYLQTQELSFYILSESHTLKARLYLAYIHNQKALASRRRLLLF